MQSFDNVTLVSFLFTTDQLPWTFLCDSSDTVAQIFQYGPAMVSSVLNISTSDVSNSALVAYQKLDTQSVSDLASVYLIYVPNDSVDSLQQLVLSSKSKFYAQDGVQGQIAKQVDPALKLTAFVSSDSTTVNGKKSSDDDSGKSSKSTTTIAAVCGAFGGVIFVLLAVLGFRHYRDKHPRDQAPNLRELQLGPGSPSVMAQRSPMSATVPGSDPRFSGATMSRYTFSNRPMSYGSDLSSQSYESAPVDPMTRGVSWYSGHYTDWNGDEPQTIYGAAITDEHHSPFADQQRTSGSNNSDSWQRQRDEGVRRLKTGQVAISRPTLAGNSLM